VTVRARDSTKAPGSGVPARPLARTPEPPSALRCACPGQEFHRLTGMGFTRHLDRHSGYTFTPAFIRT